MRLTEAPLTPIGRVQIARYACAVGDFNPVHLDEEFARAVGLPSVIAHGPLVAAVVLQAVVAQVGAHGLRAAEIRLRAPVLPGDDLTVTPTDGGAEVRKVDGSVVATLTLQGSDR